MSKAFPGGNGARSVPVQAIRRLEGRGQRGERPRFEVAVSSEAEVERQGFFGRWREVLGHDPSEVEMGRFRSGRAAVLEDHRGAPVGVIESARLDSDRVMRAEIRFSRNTRGQEVEQDVKDEIRRNISVGYIPKRAKLIEENEDRGDLWRVTLWEPVELSVVGVPADPTVGVGRDASPGTYPNVEIEDGMAVRERSMSEMTVEPGARDVRREAEEIRALARMNEIGLHRADAWIGAGLTVEQVRAVILSERETRGRVTGMASDQEWLRGGGVLDGLSRRDAGRYSYARAIRIAAGARDSSLGIRFDGIEAEVHRELERTTPAEFRSRGGGILVPLDRRTDDEVWQRTLAASTGGKGAETVLDRPGELIELLRSQTTVVPLGARVLTGLTSPMGFPKQTGPVMAYWVGENPANDVTDSDLALGIVTMAPKTLMASTAFTRQLLMQATPGVELLVRNDITEVHARAIDKAAIHGKGAAGEPFGIYGLPGVNAYAMGGVPTFAKLIDMVTEVAKDNAAVGALAFLTTVAMAGKLKQTLVAASAGSDMIWTGPFEDGRVGGFRAMASTQVSDVMNGSEETGGTSHGLIFGNFAEIIIGLYNTLELVVDPFSKKKKGLIEVTSFQMADLIVRHGESFAKATGATIT